MTETHSTAGHQMCSNAFVPAKIAIARMLALHEFGSLVLDTKSAVAYIDATNLLLSTNSNNK